MLFVPNPAASKLAELEVKTSGALRDEAEQVAAIAKSLAPVLTGAYQASIHVEETADGVAVVAGDGAVDYAVYVEVGTEDTPSFNVLTRAAEAAGLHLGS